MSGIWIATALLVMLGLGALAYWQLVIAEGAYLGSRVVVWTYNWVAARYDGIKKLNPVHEQWFVARPLLDSLADVDHPLVLDVATGTGRLPMALFMGGFRGYVVGLDLSRAMLRRAWAKLDRYRYQVTLLWEDASRLPFDDQVFNAVTCLESLEFLPDPREALAEMVRVLAPGGVLLVTNRVGREAALLPGRAIPRPEFRRLLESLPLREVQVRPWQVQYDLALARKEWVRTMGAPNRLQGAGLVDLLRCRFCQGDLRCDNGVLSCSTCGQDYLTEQGVILLADAKKRNG